MLLGAMAIAVVLDFVYYLFWSFLFSRFAFRDDLPLGRAVKCALASYAMGWVGYFLLALAFNGDTRFVRATSLTALLPGLIAALLVFLWEWRSFARHWTPDEDVGEIFE